MLQTLSILLVGSVVGIVAVAVLGALLLAVLMCIWPQRSKPVAEVLEAYAKVLGATRARRCKCGEFCKHDGSADKETAS